MSKKKLDQLADIFTNFSIPLGWKDYMNVLIKFYGFEMINKKGSRRVFVKDDERFSADEPHNRESFVSKEDRKKAIRALTRLGLLNDEVNG